MFGLIPCLLDLQLSVNQIVTQGLCNNYLKGDLKELKNS